MKFLQKIFNNKIVLYMLLIAPIIDVITGFMTINGMTITLGIIIKPIQLFLACGYLLFCDKKNQRFNCIYILLLGMYAVINIVNNMDIINTHMLEYLNYIIKYNYFIIIMLYFYRYLNNNPNINIKVLKMPIIIFTICIIVSTLTNTAFPTYDSGLGYSSWYFSGNEYSSYLSVFYPIVLYIFLERGSNNIFNILVFLAFTFGILTCGTKATFMSFYGCTIFYLLYRLLTIKKNKLDLSFVIVLLIVCSTVFYYNKIPTVINTTTQIKKIETSGETSSKKRLTRLLLSSRDDFLLRVQEYERDSNDIYIGKVYIFENKIDVIESDFFDIYYMYGLVGFVLLYGIFFYFFFRLIYIYLKHIRVDFFDSKYTLSLVSIGLVILTSLVAGHTISSPSVALFAAFILSKINVYKKVKDNNEIIIYCSETTKKLETYVKKSIDVNAKIIVKNKKNNSTINNYYIVLKRIFNYFTGEVKYTKSYMCYTKNYKLLEKLCYISSMNSTLIISNKDWKALSKTKKYYFKKECFQNIIYIDEELV